MANYEPYEREYSRRYVREERRDDRDPRFLETREYRERAYPSRELVPRAREDSDLSVEEVRRDFPPPSGRDARRARSAQPDYYEDDYDYRRRDDYRRDYDRDSRRGPGSVYIEEEEERKPKHKGMSKQEKIIAAVAGAALLAGGKELYDRREAKGHGKDVQRNALSSAALAGVGALAGYQGAEFYNQQQAKKDRKATYILHRGRDGHITEYYSDEEEDTKEKKGNKNFLESALAATGLGAAVKTLTGRGDDDKRSDTRSRGGSRSSRGSSSSRGRGTNKMQKAAMASLLAGATEAFRVAKEPGGWKGEKTRRILTAAAGAATVDAAQKDSHGKLGLAESVIGGLVGNRLINGSKNEIEEDKRTGRSRSRSRARSTGGGGGGGTGLAALATAGLGALGAKKVFDRSRSRSRGRGRDSDYSRSPSPDRRRQRSRSRSVVDKARNSLAKLGIGAGAGAGAVAAHEDSRRRDQDDFDDRGSRRSRRYSDGEYSDDYRYDRDYDGRSQRGGRDERGAPRRRGGRSDYDSSTDLGSSSEDEKTSKRMKGKLALTTGLAAVATIHAAHGVYQSMESRNARQKAVHEGRLSPAEAKRLKTKAMMQDAASVGIAALGLKGAYGELKSAKQLRGECKEFQEEKARRHERRMERRHRSESGSMRRPQTWSESSRPRYDGYDADDDFGPHYVDDNPYHSSRLPPPPVGRGPMTPRQ